MSTSLLTSWISSLYHEAFYISVEQTAIVVITRTQCKKILQQIKTLLNYEL